MVTCITAMIRLGLKKNEKNWYQEIDIYLNRRRVKGNKNPPKQRILEVTNDYSSCDNSSTDD